MEKTDNTVNDHKFVLRNVKPDVKGFHKLAPDLFAGVGGDVGIWLEQRLT